MIAATRTDVSIDDLVVHACTVPTDEPESDGTLAWDATTIVVVEACGGGLRGVGYTYAAAACAAFVEERLREVVAGRSALDVRATWHAMQRAIRNDGRSGLAAMAVSAVDIAVWDLCARLLELPLCRLLGAVRETVPVYGSGGFCSYSDARLEAQLGGWVDMGIGRVKMKVGREPERDPHRLAVARAAIGPSTELFVDANGAFGRDEALRQAWRYVEHDVRYFEEPVTSDDRAGLRLVRDRAPVGMAIAAGEYGYDLAYFRDMVEVVGVQQADVTRCGGITGLLLVAALCQARHVPLSAHCAPAASAHACAAIEPLAHLEYFHDHVRIESLLFDGVLAPVGGELRPDRARPGLGLELKRSELHRLRA